MSRTKYEPLLIGLVLLLTGCLHTSEDPDLGIKLTSDELTWIGEQVFRNECASRKTCLVHWNEGKPFHHWGSGILSGIPPMWTDSLWRASRG